MWDSRLPSKPPPLRFRVIAYRARAGASRRAIRAFAVASLLRALESGVALALEGALRVDAAAIGAQPEVLALVDVCSGEEEEESGGGKCEGRIVQIA